ncbi:MAG: NAD(+)/NADH kinase, partial [Oscillospiraceae bacterium]|nr:NAD(+)/NADH kinase [Oscillospiraceae bacterium]
VSAARGECKISRRMLLSVELVRDGEVIHRDQALNDVVLHGYGDVIQTTAFCNADKITSISGDGIILATPTGSTGYSMSAGGPIVEPDAENILISPICAHTLGARTFVLDSRRRVTVRAEKVHGRRAYLSVDGYSVADLVNGDIVNICRSEHKILMIDPGLRSFFENTYQKLR